MNLIDAALDLYLGGQCHGCGAPGRSPCPACRAGLAPDPHQVVRAGLDTPLVTAVHYRDAQPFVIAYKDREAWQLTQVLGRALVGAVFGLVRCLDLNSAPRRLVLVPVPSSPKAVRERGFDHTATLASWTGRHAGVRWSPLLRRVGQASDQVGLGASGRAANQVATMRARPGANCVIVVDDVVTTGATAIEAVRALRNGGHQVLGVAAIADTPLSRPPGILVSGSSATPWGR